jgi:transposase
LGLRGRPTLYKPEFCDQLIEQMAEGLSFMAAMERIGVSRQTGYSWVKQHEEFLEAFELGKGKRLLFLERRLLSARSHGVVTSTIFALKNACPEEWRDRHQLEHASRNDNPIQSSSALLKKSFEALLSLPSSPE